MKTITSLSGGKSSAYMAVHFPTDYYLFAVVLTDQSEVAPKDPGLLRECQRRIPGFIASRELDQTLLNVLKLEELLGKEVRWIAASDSQENPGMIQDKNDWHPTPLTYDALIRYRKALPNKLQRFCTEQLKIYAIFWHTYLNLMEDDKDIVQINIGFRWDEGRRVDDMLNRCDKISFPYQCPVGSKDKKSKHQWIKIDWRIPNFPMFDNRIDKLDVLKFWVDKGWVFPSVSNCDGCFHHRQEELQTQANLYPERMQWWKDWECNINGTWKDRTTYENLLKYRQQSLFDEVESVGCFCTD